MLERQKEFVACELGRRVKEERKVVEDKRSKRRVDQEVEKLKGELSKAERDAQLMSMIAENYEKEIARRRA